MNRWQKLHAARPGLGPFLLLALLSVTIHLVGLAQPRSVVFDEVHFGKYATHYCCDHQRFFDIHPPTGKLVIAGTAWLLGYRGQLHFDHISQPYTEASPVPLRLAPALAGLMLPLLVFLLLRLLGASPPAALLGGLLLVFDNALTVTSRMIGLDSIMLFGMFGGLACWLAAQRATSWRASWSWILACGLLLGLGVGSKLVGLAMLGLVGLAILVDIVRTGRLVHGLRRLGQGGVILLAVIGVYLGSWALHFHLLTLPGPGDIWGVPDGGFLQAVYHRQMQMLAANDSVGQSVNASPWWSWPWMLKPIFYWAGKKGASIWLFGNPLVWWGASLAFVTLLGNLVLKHAGGWPADRETAPSLRLLWLPIAGYAMCYLPFMVIGRVMFLYHYLPALIFSVLACILWLDRSGWIRPERCLAQRKSYYLVIACVLAAFLVLVPLTYGLHAGSGLDNSLINAYRGWIQFPGG